ncbi:DUF1778 domain-containing protein [Legionella waltersii]|uniref:DUF1778 domain-containing protein n=1 Tax=Legionella waltersii TaxID=66969 RepID=A0A0W1A0J8_9GAMM|nr:DUF1778 domain-containing protein [Legionella waltersii]KTD74822.1 hypothetical protein Lwal_2863 [Legionella waltersii]SNV11620.1 Uncharacterized protein conserved in bacteria [Legionella waltersii]
MVHVSKHSNEVERLEARISSAKKSVLKDAASLKGISLTDFVVNSAYEAAQRVIKEYEQLQLTEADRVIFIQALLNPPKPSENLVKAANRYKKGVQSK